MKAERIAPSFHCLNAAQFLGALNENRLKLLVILFLIGVRGSGEASTVAATAGAVFIVPFLLFSAWAGALADRWSKRTLVVGVKAAEVACASSSP